MLSLVKKKLPASKLIIHLIIAILVIFNGCHFGDKETSVEKINEDGVEVVINHHDPYEIKDESNKLSLEKLFTIDTESESLLKLGLANIRKLDIDSAGNIFIFQSPQPDMPLVFTFDRQGHFENAFGKMGQGPEEIQYPDYLGLNNRDEVLIIDSAKRKLLFLSQDGDVLKETAFDLMYRPQRGISLLENGEYLVHHLPSDPSGEIDKIAVSIFDEKFHLKKTLTEYPFPGAGNKKMSVFLSQVPVIGLSQDAIYLGYGEENDIHVYDFNGTLERKIRRKYKPVPVPEKLIEELKENLAGRPVWDQLFIPEYMPPFQYFFTDSRGRLYAVTSEKSESEMNICDIYTPDGVLIERKALGYYDLSKFIYLNESLDIMAKDGRLYCMREKESGFEELIVYKMDWE